MKNIFFLVILFNFCHVNAQNIKVIKPKNSFISNNRELKNGDYIKLSDTIKIRGDGKLTLKFDNGKINTLNKGIYTIDSSYNIHRNFYTRNNEINERIKNAFPNGLEECNTVDICGTYLIGLTDSVKDSIKYENGGVLVKNTLDKSEEFKFNNNILTLTIYDKNDSGVGYYVAVMNFFSQYLEFKYFPTKIISLYNDFLLPGETAILTIYTIDKRKSRDFRISN